MEIDKKVLPDPENTPDVADERSSSKFTSEDLTSKKEASAANIPAEAAVDKSNDLKTEFEALKQKNFELQKQKEHWKEKYERDITNKSSVEDKIDEDLLSDEGKMLRSQLEVLEKKFHSLEKEKEETRVFTQYPLLRDRREEFQEFLENPDNIGIKLERAAKLFLAEQGLLENPPKRLGLERPTSGSKSPQPKLSVDDIKRLRETQPRRYTEMLKKGLINPDEI